MNKINKKNNKQEGGLGEFIAGFTSFPLLFILIIIIIIIYWKWEDLPDFPTKKWFESNSKKEEWE